MPTPFLLNLWCSDRNVLIIVRENKSAYRLHGITDSSLTGDTDLIGQRIGLADASAHLQHSTRRNATAREECKIFSSQLTRNAPTRNFIDNIICRLAHTL